MPYRNARGSWRIRKQFGWVNGTKVGKVDVSLGTTDEADAIAIEKALLKLPALDRPDLLLDVQKGRRTPQDVYRMVMNQTIHDTPNSLEGTEPLEIALTEWLTNARKKNGFPVSDETKKSYAKGITRLGKFTKKFPLVRDLPELMQFFKDRCIERGTFRTFDKTRAMVLAFIRTTNPKGQHSDLYREISRIGQLGGGRDRHREGLMVWEARALLKNLPERYRNLTWLFLCTGLEVKEYQDGIEILPDRILIHGKKNPDRDRFVPRLSDFVLETPPKSVGHWNTHLTAAYGKTFTTLDLRSTYRQWLRDAGIPEQRADRYMGHRVTGVKAGYLTSDLNKHLASDTEKLVAYLEANWEKPESAKTKELPKFKLAL